MVNAYLSSPVYSSLSSNLKYIQYQSTPMNTCPIHQPPIIAMCSTHNTHISPYWLDLLYTFNVCVPYEGDQHIYLIPIVWSIMAHEDNANINSMSTLHSSPFLTNPACKHHWSFQSQSDTPQTVQHETHPPW